MLYKKLMVGMPGVVLTFVLVLGGCAEIDDAPEIKGITQLALDNLMSVSVTGDEPAVMLETDEYVGSIAWKDLKGQSDFSIFQPNTVYRAVAFLAAKDGYTFAGSGSFTHNKADTILQEQNTSGGVTVTVTFPATVAPTLTQVSDIAPYLAKWESPVSLKLGLELSSANWQGILAAFNTANKDVVLDLSTCLASTSTAQGGLSSTGGIFNSYGEDMDANRKNAKKKIQELILPDAARAIASGPVEESGPHEGPAPGKEDEDLGNKMYGIFKNFNNLKKVRGANIETIAESAFLLCVNLETVDFPQATIIEDGAFIGCLSLTTVIFSNVEIIGRIAFSTCESLENIDISNAITIGEEAFTGCISLKTVSLPNADSIGNDAFFNCTNLETISLPAATSIGNNAFTRCTSLKTIDLSAAEAIGSNAFTNCTSLETIDLSAAESIGSNAFANCTSLETVTLGSVLPTLGSNIFFGIASAQTVTIQVPSDQLDVYNHSNAYSDADDFENWGNAFRGMGWYLNWDDSYDYGSPEGINTSIQLVFEPN
ncbi:MAG: leucine-rich repeat domain-containing protein [Spirochaetaceae bacterium]|jgi:hypothetical protein|nr:leucine-rich repeat domain-containing protein [Spirochaetaceae bacterium]